MRYTLVDTALGVFGLAWTEAGVARVALPGRDRAQTEEWISRGQAEPGRPEGVYAPLPGMMERYAEGERIEFGDLPLDLSEVPEFHRQAYAELL